MIVEVDEFVKQINNMPGSKKFILDYADSATKNPEGLEKMLSTGVVPFFALRLDRSALAYVNATNKVAEESRSCYYVKLLELIKHKNYCH